jgi:sigma-B regulation protein RsbU (phosphoserine phosphatase)
MTQTTLKKLLNPRKPTFTIIADLLHSISAPVAIIDIDGTLLAGKEYVGEAEKNAVAYEEQRFGWVLGPEPQSTIIARLLGQMLAKEAEKRSLAHELLDKYRELNLLYNLSEHLLSTPDPQAIAATTLSEAARLIQVSAAWLLLLDEDSAGLNLIATAGGPWSLDDCIGQEDLVVHVLATREAEIRNRVPTPNLPADYQTKKLALICAPLKTEQRVLGVILLAGAPPTFYTAHDLKLLNTVALQAAPAIEMARLYQIAHIQGRMERELQLAYDVQASLIPAELPSSPAAGWDFAGRWRPARELSGDYYDVIPEGGESLGLVIGDVADKGMPSALFMVHARSAVRAAVDQAGSPAAAISRANRLVAQESTDGLFVTLWYGRLNTLKGDLTYVNAGHNPPLLYQAASDKMSSLDRTGMPLGIISGASFAQSHVQLQPGDFVVLYTDGVTEAMDSEQAEFGMDRLLAVVSDNNNASAEELATAIETAVDEFTSSALPFDDFTLLIARRLPLV